MDKNDAASFVVVTNLCLRPLVRNINRRMVASNDVETGYMVSLTCRSVEEAHLRSLLLHALSQAESSHAQLWRDKLAAAGVHDERFVPRFRTRLLARLAQLWSALRATDARGYRSFGSQ